MLEAAAAAARGGQPQVVLVEGEAGIGKSTLLTRFAAGLAGATVLRAGGDESELLLPYGIVGQLVASAHGAGGSPAGLLASDLSDRVDPLAVGADLVTWLGQLCRGQGMVLAAIDDLQWADGPSARALLFAVRRLHADQVLVVVAARAGELPRLGDGWQRFLAGDHRASRIRLGGLEPEDVMALGRAVGAGELPRRAVGRLLEETGGNPLYCRAVLEEAGAGGLDQPGGELRVPRSLAGTVLARVGSLSPAARQLVVAAAVLGHHCELAAASALADLGDPLPALGEAMAAGILAERLGGAGVGFSHPLVRRAVYDDLCPARRRGLHERAAGLVDRQEALGHRVAAAVGPDDGLAAELEAVGREAMDLGRTGQAVAWLAQAAAVSSDPAAADRRLLDALEILVFYGEVAEAEVLAARVAAGPGARRSWLLGALDFLAGRAATAEARLVEAWRTHDPAGDPFVGAAAALHWRIVCDCGPDPGGDRMGSAGGRGGRPGRSAPRRAGRAGGRPISSMGGDLRAWPGWRSCPPSPPRCRGRTATRWCCGASLGYWPRTWPGRSPIFPPRRRGCGPVSRCAPPAMPELSGSRRVPPRLLGRRRGARRAGRLARPRRRPGVGVQLGAQRRRYYSCGSAATGSWPCAHVRMATEAAQATGDVGSVGAAAIARAFLAMARGDLDGAAGAAAALRATGRAEFVTLLGRYDWRSVEIEALIGLGRLGQAETALAELEAALSPAGPPSALVAAARLRGDLASAAGDHATAAAAFENAWRHAHGLRMPLVLAQLEISDARRLRAASQPQAAIARLRSARQRLITLGARPYLQSCDRELAAAGAPA